MQGYVLLFLVIIGISPLCRYCSWRIEKVKVDNTLFRKNKHGFVLKNKTGSAIYLERIFDDASLDIGRDKANPC